MSNNFKLTLVNVIDWQGNTGVAVPVKVESVPAGATAITINDVFYGGVRVKDVNGATATVPLITGTNELRVSIQPMVRPAIVWRLVEVGADGTLQELDKVNEFGPAQDPDSTAIRIIGVGK